MFANLFITTDSLGPCEWFATEVLQKLVAKPSQTFLITIP